MTTPTPVPAEWTKKTISDFLKGKSPIRAAFEMSIAHLSRTISVTSDEETITAAFLGSLMANYPWCVLSSNVTDIGTSCSWASYSKSGHDPKSESSSGADFALVMTKRTSVMVAIFQAKKALLKKDETYAVNIYRKRDEKELVDVKEEGGSRKRWVKKGFQTAQIDRLLDTAKLLEGQALTQEERKADANSWIHYLGYKGKGVSCVHLSKVPQEKIDMARTGTEAQCDVEITALNSKDWVEVLTDGLVNDASPYWLPMEFEAAKKYLPELLPLMSVVIVDEGKGGEALRFSVEMSDVQEVVVKRRDEKLREPMKKVLGQVLGLMPEATSNNKKPKGPSTKDVMSKIYSSGKDGGGGKK